ncbi:MAG: YicC/YloC family endoribonuclease [Rhodospirillaceae bacterium]
MTLSSMTGFSSVSDDYGGYSWSWELRSVNSRTIDIRIKLPNFLEGLDQGIRRLLVERFARGSITVQLILRSPARDFKWAVDEKAVGELFHQVISICEKYDVEHPKIESLLRLPGIIEKVEAELSEREISDLTVALKNSFVLGVTALTENRAEEGNRLKVLIENFIHEIDIFLSKLKVILDSQTDMISQNFFERFNKILKAGDIISEDRLAQEVAILVTKSDIREETDRIDSHIQAVREMIADEGPCGRKLDFLCQELNREANTICSKANALNITEIGLGLKSAIDSLREQVQNIE